MKSAAIANAVQAGSAAELRRHLFYETSHSPALADLVGYENAKDIVDFCFIANPYYPTPEMLEDLQRNLPNLIKSYPSSNPLISQKNLAAVLHVDPERLIIGNGATELITLIDMTLIDRIAVPIPTFGEYIEKMKDQRDAELYPLDPESGYSLRLDDYLAWVHQRNLECLVVINPGNPTGQFIPLEEMMDFLRRASDLELVIVDESFIDFAGDPIPSLLPIADQFTNLLIVRSMSKHCGVPGLRLGYCYSANLFVLNRLRRFLPTWNLNTLAQYFLSLLPPTDAAYHEGRKRLIARCPLALRRAARHSLDRRVSDRREFCALQNPQWHDCNRASGAPARRAPDVRPRLLEQAWHGRVSHSRRLARPRERRPAGGSAFDSDALKMR